jgi:predicted metallopeptidase
MADFRKINEHYAEIAAELIEEEPALEYIAESNVTIVYLSSDSEKTNKGKVVCGQCEKVPDKYRWGIPADFTITVFEPNVEKFTDEQIKILLFHELLHIGIEEDGNEERYFIRPHDLEDFKLIIDRFGTEWSWAE